MLDDTTEPRGLGAHLKTAIVGAHEQIAGRINEHKQAHVASVLEQFEADLAPMLAPMVEELLANPGMPDHLKALLGQVGAPEHFSSSLLIGVAVGAIIGPVLGSAVEPYVQNIANEAWSLNPSRPLSPDLLAAAVLKGVLSQADATPMAKQSGYSADHFATMVLTAGQSLGLAEALLLERRDQLVDITIDDVLRYNNMNPRFYASAKNLKYIPPSSGEVITGALKTHLTHDDAKVRLGYAGIDPVNFDWLLATAGRPISPLEALDLWNRDEIDESQVDSVIAQSDINPAFGPMLKLLKVQYPPPRSVIPMLRANAITETQARTLLSYHGLPVWVQDAYIAEVGHPSSSAVKQLSQSQIVASYEAHLIDRATAITRLEALTYSPADAATLVDLADERKTLAQHNATVRMLGARYIAHRLTLPETMVLLNEVPVAAADQADLIKLWNIERQANVPALTHSAIIGAYRRGQITAIQTKNRLLAMGFDEGDLGILVADGFPPTKPNPGAVAAVVDA